MTEMKWQLTTVEEHTFNLNTCIQYRETKGGRGSMDGQIWAGGELKGIPFGN